MAHLDGGGGRINTTRLADGTVMVDVRGELDFPQAEKLRDTILAKVRNVRPQGVVVDLSLVTFMDSAALGALVTAQQAAADLGISLAVVNPSAFVARLLDVTGLGDTLGYKAA